MVPRYGPATLVVVFVTAMAGIVYSRAVLVVTSGSSVRVIVTPKKQ